MGYRMTSIPLQEFLESAIRDNKSYGEKYQVEFTLGEVPDGIEIYADPDRMMQVMSNLMSNAAKFSPPKSKVEIYALRDGNRTRICIKDYGYGIPQEFHARIFDKFTQADSSDRRQMSGTGLGLNISKGIVEQHNGKLSFTSHQDKGSEFFIDLFDHSQGENYE
tara:strand:+ start:73 stop:564 length:492 start_codon:yes stop_codon:yes gene_type:complete